MRHHKLALMGALETGTGLADWPGLDCDGDEKRHGELTRDLITGPPVTQNSSPHRYSVSVCTPN